MLMSSSQGLLYNPTRVAIKEMIQLEATWCNNNRSVDKKTFAKEVQTTRPILDIYFGDFTFSLALSDSLVFCPSSGVDN